MIGLLAAVIPLAFYLGYPSTYWNFDGVACAAALELGNPVYFFHAQHLLYGFLGFLVWKLLLPLGLARALPALQIFSSLLSATALYVLWRLLVSLSNDEWLALLLTCAAGFSAVFWTWSTEAQVYPLGVLGLAMASYLLLAAPTSSRMKQVGIWHGVAVLGHLVHGLWIIPALYWIYKEKLPWRSYLAAFAGTVTLAYSAVAFFVLRPYHGHGPWLNHWLKGSLGLSADRSMAWHWPGWNGIFQWAQATPGVLWGTFWPYGELPFPRVLHAVTFISILLLMGLAFFYGRRSKLTPLAIFSGIWLGVYALFFSTWEPQTLCYRMTDLLPFTLLLMSACLVWPRRRTRLALAGCWMLSLGVINFFARARPMHDSMNNPFYQQTITLAKTTPDHSLYMTSGGLMWIYMLYFTGRSTWNTHLLSLDEFDQRWSNLKPRPSLYAASVLLQNPETASWLTRHHLKIMPGLPWLEVS
jgi:hypothetical protein